MSGPLKLFLGLVLVAATLAGVAPARAQPNDRKVSGRVQTLSDVQKSLQKGPHAILFLGRSPVDIQICEIFKATYQATFATDSPRLIFFTKRADYAKPVIDCAQLKEAYDIHISTDLDDDLRVSQFRPPRLLMLVCRDVRGTLMNKGFVVFDTGDPDAIQAKFNAFEKHYRKGPGAWEDERQIDKPFEVLTIFSDLIPGKNTRCK